jgi:hypothetical protein
VLHSLEFLRIPEASKSYSDAVSLTLTAEAYQQEGRYCAAQDDLEDAHCKDNTDNGDILMVCVRQDLPFEATCGMELVPGTWCCLVMFALTV